MSNHKPSQAELEKVVAELQAELFKTSRTQDAVEVLMVYFMLTHGKDVGNMRKEFTLTRAEMEKLDPNHTHGIGIYFEHNATTHSVDLRCVCAPKESLLEEAYLAYGDMKGSA